MSLGHNELKPGTDAKPWCWLDTCSAPSHHLNQCWNIVVSTLLKKKKNLWNLNQNMSIFVLDNLFRNVVRNVSKTVAILSLPQCISWSQHLLLCGYWERLNGNFMSYKPQSSKFNLLWPSDTIWRHRSGSTLAQVMACCLTAPSHYLNQYWLIISKV